ncbi:hypothetical protein ACE1CD_21050 [Aerosakkonema sp. BLCC-F183]|uniref:hypothetical protein n=1 Tax=Aerosakkonema sp. BLCC-F183 TaxID=3342834 RepID=UPI0035B9F5E5
MAVAVVAMAVAVAAVELIFCQWRNGIVFLRSSESGNYVLSDQKPGFCGDLSSPNQIFLIETGFLR